MKFSAKVILCMLVAVTAISVQQAPLVLLENDAGSTDGGSTSTGFETGSADTGSADTESADVGKSEYGSGGKKSFLQIKSGKGNDDKKKRNPFGVSGEGDCDDDMVSLCVSRCEVWVVCKDAGAMATNKLGKPCSNTPRFCKKKCGPYIHCDGMKQEI